MRPGPRGVVAGLRGGLGALALLGGVACGGGGGGSGLPAATCPGGLAPVRVVWDRLDPAGLPPFPSDWFTVADPTAGTGRRLHIAEGENLPIGDGLATDFAGFLHELGTLDGWGTSAAAVVPLTGPVDLVASGGTPLATGTPPERPRYVFDGPGAPIAYLQLERRDAADGDGGGAAGHRAAAVVELLENDVLIVEPLEPLRTGTSYALVLTRDLAGADAGQGPTCVVGSDAWRREAYAVGDPGPPGSPGARLRALVTEAVDRVEQQGEVQGGALDREHLALALPFTTQTIVGPMRRARGQAAAATAPAVVPGSLVVREHAAGPLAAEVRGRYRAPDYRGADRVWTPDPATGALVPRGELELDFVLHLPREQPALGRRQPFPLSIYVHGLAGDLEEARGPAERIADSGVATIAMSAVGHRSGSETLSVFEFFDLVGIATGSDTAFRVVRDNFRQSALDQLQLLRVARGLMADGVDVAAPLGVPDLDPDVPVGVVGLSLGGVMSPTLMALDPELDWGVHYVGGGVVSKLIRDSPLFELLIPVFQLILSGGELEENPPDAVPMFFSLMQTVLEAGDPVNYARALVVEPPPGARPRNLLSMQVVPDRVVPNSSNEALARALGLPLVGPPVAPVSGLGAAASPLQGNVGVTVTAGLFQYDDYRRAPDAEPEPADHFTIGPAVETRLQAGLFVRSYLAGRPRGEAPVIVDPFDPEQVAALARRFP